MCSFRSAVEWMGADETLIEADAQPLKDLGEIPKRTLIIGVNDSAFPLMFSFKSQRKAMPKNAQTTTHLHSSHTLVIMLKIL